VLFFMILADLSNQVGENETIDVKPEIVIEDTGKIRHFYNEELE